MQERLFIRLPASDGNQQSAGSVVWFIWHSQQQEVIASGELESPLQLDQLQQQAKRCETTIVLPGQDVLSRQVELPAGSRRHLERVIPYALEEELVTDIEQLHFSWPDQAIKDKGPIPVFITAKAAMRQWQQWLTVAGIDADHWVPDYLLLPWQDGQWSALQIGSSLVVRTSQWQGFSIESELVEQGGEAFSNQWQAPTAIQHFGDIQWPTPPAALQAADIEVPLSALAQTQPPLELRKGEFAVKRKRTLDWNWKPLALAASVVFLMLVGGNLLRGWQLNSQAEALQQQAEAMYLKAFPNKTRIVNLRLQLQQELRSLGASSNDTRSALQLLDTLQPAFAKLPGMTLELLRYQDGELRLQALAANFEQFEQFTQQAQQLGLSVEQGALNNRGSQVAGSLTIATNQGGRS